MPKTLLLPPSSIQAESIVLFALSHGTLYSMPTLGRRIWVTNKLKETMYFTKESPRSSSVDLFKHISNLPMSNFLSTPWTSRLLSIVNGRYTSVEIAPFQCFVLSSSAKELK